MLYRPPESHYPVSRPPKVPLVGSSRTGNRYSPRDRTPFPTPTPSFRFVSETRFRDEERGWGLINIGTLSNPVGWG